MTIMFDVEVNRHKWKLNELLYGELHKTSGLSSSSQDTKFTRKQSTQFLLDFLLQELQVVLNLPTFLHFDSTMTLRDDQTYTLGECSSAAFFPHSMMGFILLTNLLFVTNEPIYWLSLSGCAYANSKHPATIQRW